MELAASVGKFVVVWGLTALWVIYAGLMTVEFFSVPYELWGEQDTRIRGWILGLGGILVAVVQGWWWWT